MKDQDHPSQHAEVRDQNEFQEMVGSFDANQNHSGLEAIEDPHHQQTTDLIFCDEFPSLPDFSCMSSSSSTSSTPSQSKAISCASSSSSSSSSTSSSCSTASWAVLKSDVEENKQQVSDQGDVPPPTALSSTSSTEVLPFDQNIDDEMACMDIMMESIGFMDLMEDNNDVWDTSSIFQQENYENKPWELSQLQGGGSERVVDGAALEQQQQPQTYRMGGIENEDLFFLQDDSSEQGQRNKEDLALVFFEWLKSNKESISAEDLRSIKLKTTTVEAAAKRLGGGKEGMKRLLKLILEWVQNNHLQRKRKREQLEASNDHQKQFLCYDNQHPPAEPTLLNPSPSTLPPDPNSCFSPSAWNLGIPPNLYAADPTVVGVPAPGPGFTSMLGYVGETFPSGAQNIVNGNVANYSPHSPPASGYQTHMLDSSQTWVQSQYGLASPYGFQDNNNLPQIMPYPPTFSSGAGGTAGYSQFAYPYVPGNGERLATSGSSATKEARKKRMARQRRFLSHRHNQNHQNQQLQNQGQLEAEVMLGNENSNMIQSNANWVYWPSPTLPMPVVPSLEQPSQTSPVIDRPVVHAQSYQRPIIPERRPGWKPEKNLRFLLQKVLKQSDVGNLGRIVLPKKEAETHLPELEARDGINIPMEDIGTSRIWNMRYRFWPNNKSRMYLLENTGDFVKSNGLQEGDFIVLYSDVKCGKYMIRGVKVRQQGAKAESKRPAKAQKKNSHSSASPAGNGTTPASVNKQIDLTKASMDKGGETALNLDGETHG